MGASTRTCSTAKASCAACSSKGHTLQGKRALVLGCGGAGAAIAVSLADAGVARITLCDLNYAKADAFAAQLDASCEGCV